MASRAFRLAGWLLASTVGAGACESQPAETLNPPPVLTVAPGPVLARLATCGDRTFPVERILEGERVDNRKGEPYDTLRVALGRVDTEFPGAQEWDWRVAVRDDRGALFVARPDDADLAWRYFAAAFAPTSGWRSAGMDRCAPLAALAGFGAARWWLDPAALAPHEDSRELSLLVAELACGSSQSVAGRLSPPQVMWTATSVTITLGVRPLSGSQSCGSTTTPIIVDLGAALGPRELLDGALIPAADPGRPNL